MTKLGIIPAAGRGKRFGGALKELLPVSNEDTLLSRTLKFLEDIPVDNTVLITNGYKWAAHAQTVTGHNVTLVEQKSHNCDAWGAIVETLPLAGDMNYYLMPDTYIPARSYFDEFPEGDFVMGLFTTVAPERFGVLIDGEIRDKDESLKGIYRMAWGMLIWSGAVAKFWEQNLDKIASHTQAFNMAIKEFGYNTFRLPFYYDVSCFEDYKRLLEHV